MIMDDFEVIEEINDESLYLRKITLNDALFFYESLKDSKMTEYLSLGPLESLDYAKSLLRLHLKWWKKYLQFNYIIEERTQNNATRLGSIALWNVSWLHKRSEIGLWLLPTYWNKGIGTKVVSLSKNIAFIHLKLHRLEAHVAVENELSVHLFKKCGFVKEGVLKEYLLFNEKFHDALIFACVGLRF